MKRKQPAKRKPMVKQKQPKKKETKGNGERKGLPSTDNTFLELKRLRDLRQQEQDEAKRVELAKQHKVGIDAFKKWKADVVWLVEHRSKIHVLPSGQAQFILPPELVRLVWQVTIKERIAAERAKGTENAVAKAMEGLRDEMGELAHKYREVVSQAKGKADDESKDAGNGKADGGSVVPIGSA